MSETCKVCRKRKIINKDGVYYNHCKSKQRDDTPLKENDFGDSVCKKFKAIVCEKVPYKRVELFRANK